MYPQRTRARARSRRRRRRWPLFLLVFAIALCALGASQLGFGQMHRLKTADLPDWVDQQIIPAQANRNYFAQPDTQVSAHFLIGLEGEVIQCIPLNEKSSATNDRNRDTISIEVCHPDATGQFTQASYDALVRLTAWLCDTAGIGRDQVIRHYDVTGKLCPLYFVEHEEAWTQFLADVAAY